MNDTSIKWEKALETLVGKRFETKHTLKNTIQNILGVKEIENSVLEESTNEDNLNLDYELLMGIETEDNYYYITIYYLKTRCYDMYITEVSVDNE